MTIEELHPEKTENWLPKVLLIGGAIGALIGVAGAYLMAQQAEKEGRPPTVTSGDAVRLGVLVLGLLRSVAALGEHS